MSTHRRETNHIIALGLLDILLTVFSLYLATWARYVFPWGVRLPWHLVVLPWPVYLMSVMIWPIVLSLVSAYAFRLHSVRRLLSEIYALLLGVGIASMALAGCLYFTYRDVPRRLFLYFGIINFCLLAFVRFLIYWYYRLAHHNGRAMRLLIVGAGRVGEEIARQVHHRGTSWQLVGLLDDDPAKAEQQIVGCPVLGTLDALEDIVQSYRVDEVIFALPSRAHNRLAQLVLELERLPVEISVVPDYFNLAFFRAKPNDFFGFPLIRLRASAIEGEARIIKRLLDIMLAIPLLLLCLPFFFLVAFLIRLDSPGPILFRQERVGENCQIFGMWKFRTMVQNAEALQDQVVRQTPDNQVIHKIPDDPRVTRVGRFLRRHSIDELPQLINVIKGEMSLVGPRPELVWLVDRYQGWQRKRFAVPAGMTGWWQISGRSERMMHLHVEDDLYYINNYSFWLDLHILWCTFAVVISGEGAY